MSSCFVGFRVENFMDVLLQTMMIFLWKIVVSVVSDHSTISVRII